SDGQSVRSRPSPGVVADVARTNKLPTQSVFEILYRSEGNGSRHFRCLLVEAAGARGIITLFPLDSIGSIAPATFSATPTIPCSCTWLSANPINSRLACAGARFQVLETDTLVHGLIYFRFHQFANRSAARRISSCACRVAPPSAISGTIG